MKAFHRIVVVLLPLFMLVSSPVWADIAPGHYECDTSGDVCNGYVDSSSWVGLCYAGKCESRVTVSELRRALAAKPLRTWGPHGLALAGILALGGLCWAVDRGLRRRRERTAKALEQTLPARSFARKALAFVLPTSVLVAIYAIVFHGSLAAASKEKTRWYEPPISTPTDARASLENFPDEPLYAATPEGGVVITSLVEEGRQGNLIVAYDAATQKPLWWRAPKEWLELPLRFTVHQGKAIIIDGDGHAEIRDPRSGAILRTTELEYRIRRLEGIDGEAAIKVWDTRTMDNALSLETGTYELRSTGGYRGARKPCSGATDKKWWTAIPETIQHSCETEGGLVAVVSTKEKTFELLALDPKGQVLWRVPTKPVMHSFGATIRMGLAGGLVLVLEDCTGKKCHVIAHDLGSGERRWQLDADDDVTLESTWGGAGVVLVEQREGTWTQTQSPTWRYDAFQAKDGKLIGTIPARP